MQTKEEYLSILKPHNRHSTKSERIEKTGDLNIKYKNIEAKLTS